MEFINAILICVSIILLFYVYLRLRNKIEYLEEGFKSDWPTKLTLDKKTKLTLDEKNELSQLQDTPPLKKIDYIGDGDETEVNNAATEYQKIMQMPLRELSIKASYNTAYDGQTFSIAQVGKVMAQGYRYLDFQLFSASGGVLYVGHSDSPNTESIDTALTFSELLGYISQYAFTPDKNARLSVLNMLESKEPTENKKGLSIYDNYTKYPLFVNLRINRAPNSSLDIIDTIYKKYLNPKSKTPIILPEFLLRKEGYAVPIDAETQLTTLKRKIVFVMDIDNILQNYTKSHNADDVPIATRKRIQQFVNIKSGGHTWKTFNNYTTIETLQKIPLYTKEDGTTNTQNMYLALPAPSNSANPPALQYLQNYRIQTCPNRLYIDDTNLSKYEKMYEEMKKPIVPLAHLLRYAKQTEQ